MNTTFYGIDFQHAFVLGRKFSTPFEHKIKALYQTVSCLVIDGKRCRPLLNACLIAEFGFQDFQRGQLQSIQLGYMPHCLS